jgi:hypothetical protein
MIANERACWKTYDPKILAFYESRLSGYEQNIENILMRFSKGETADFCTWRYFPLLRSTLYNFCMYFMQLFVYFKQLTSTYNAFSSTMQVLSPT